MAGATTMERGAERRLTAFGVTKTVEEWSMDRRAAVYAELILRRLEEGMAPEQAIALPLPNVGRGPVKILAWGERKTLREWADDLRCQTSMQNLRMRLQNGWPPESALSAPTNARRTTLVEAFGEAKSVRAWSEDGRSCGCRNAIMKRLDEGMDPEEAITTPVRAMSARGLTAFGETKTLEEWTKDPRCEVSEATLSQRRKMGMSPEEAITKPSPFAVRPEEERIAGLPSHTRAVSAFGERKSLNAWLRDPRCAVQSINPIRERIESGWSPEEAITTPPQIAPLVLEAWGETKKASEWLKDPRCVVGQPCLHQRLKKGMDAEEAMSRPSAEGWIDRPMEAFGETKSLREWLQDARCRVSYDVLHSRITNYGYGLELALSAPTVGCKRGRYGEFVEAFGERKLLGEWMGDARCVVGRKTLGGRLRAGWDLQTAMTAPEYANRPTNVQGVFVEAFGERKNLRQWSKDARCAVSESVLAQRLIRGWDVERSLTLPPLDAKERIAKRGPRGAELRIAAWGETRRIGAWAKDARCVVRVPTLRNRIDKGWSPEEAMTTPAGGGREEREARAAAWALAVERDGARALAMAFGEAKTVADWASDPRARAWGEAIAERLAQGVPPEEAITRPADATAASAPRVMAWGERKTVVDWSDDPRAAVGTGLIRSRLEKGWDPERAISTPAAEPSVRMMEAFGETKCLAAWAEDERAAVCMWTIRKRLAEGWSLEAALATPGREALEGGLTAFGETKPLAAWALDPRCEVGPSNIGMRLRRGLTPEEAISRKSHLVRHGENAPEGSTVLEAWGDAKALSEWLADPRCVVGVATLKNRIADGVAPEVALASPDASPWKDGVTAWGETKSVAAWARDPRCTVNPGQVAVRLGKGMPPEEAISGVNRAAKAEPLGEDRPRGLSRYASLVTAWGETKTPQAWSRDARCTVTAETIRRRIEGGMGAEAAILSPKETHEATVTAWGETKRVSEWVRDPRCAMTQNGLRTRLERGMSPEEAMTRPAPKRGEANLLEAFGERKTLNDWVADPRCRVSYNGLRKRLMSGATTPEEALTRPFTPQDREKHAALATAFGETKSLVEWIKDPRATVSRGALTLRIKRGWPLEDALTLPEGAIHPLKDHRRMLTAWGETKTLKDWSKDPRCVVAESTIAYRIDRGWPLDQALTHPQMTNAVGRGSRRRGLSKPHARKLEGRAA